MIEKWNGLVIRSTDIGDYDRILTVLTAERGKITVFCRGVKRFQSRIAHGTDLYTYAEFVLFRGKEDYRLQECSPIETFFSLRQDIEKLSLAGYFCDVANEICLEDNNERDMLQLLLNALWCLQKGEKPPQLIKAAYEFRSAAIAGFAPDLSICLSCKNANGSSPTLDVMAGGILCGECAERTRDALLAGALDPGEARILLPLSQDVLAGLHYILTADAKRQFSFTVDPSVLPQLNAAAETYLISHIGHSFKTLSFYKSLAGM